MAHGSNPAVDGVAVLERYDGGPRSACGQDTKQTEVSAETPASVRKHRSCSLGRQAVAPGRTGKCPLPFPSGAYSIFAANRLQSRIGPAAKPWISLSFGISFSLASGAC